MRKTFLFPSNNGQNLVFANSFVSKRTRFALVYWEAVPTRSECTTMREVMFTFDMSISLLKCTCEIDTFSYIFLFINFINTANVAGLVFLLNVNYLFFTMRHSFLRYLRYDTTIAFEILVLRLDHCVYDRQRGSIYTRRSFKSFKRQSVSKTNWNVQVKLKWLEARFARNHYQMFERSIDCSSSVMTSGSCSAFSIIIAIIEKRFRV